MASARAMSGVGAGVLCALLLVFGLAVPARGETSIGARQAHVKQLAAPRSFYVDVLGGRDSNAGTSPQAPWRTLARANAGSYRGGDEIRLRGGERYAGTLRVNPANFVLGRARTPLTITSYGSGRALIEAGRRDAIRAENVSGVHISNLELSGASVGCRPHSYGILFLAQSVFGTLAAGISIDHVDVHGFCDGIVIAAGDDASHFKGVSVTESAAHDNGDAGVFTFDPALKHHDIREVLVAGVQAYNNAGTGGIALFGVDGGVVEHSVAHDNGASGEGGVGIWAFDSNHVTIQYSESYRNRTTGADGDGFDLDGGVSNSVLQYDYSHDNAGIGFLVCACVPFYAMHSDVVRYNVSQNDGTNGQPSALYVLGGEPFHDLEVFNNSFYSAAGEGPLILLDGGGRPYRRVHLRNNLLAVAGGKPLLEVPAPREARQLMIQGNDWWANDGRFAALWGGLVLHSLAEMQARAHIEQLSGEPVGLSADPRVCALGAAGTLYPAPPSALAAYELRTGSPLLGAGLDLESLFATQVGTTDFGGDASSRAGAFDIGADEHQPARGC